MAGHPQSNVFFEDIQIPRRKVLVSGEDGTKRLLRSLNWERIGDAVFSNAITRCAVSKELAYAQDREQFGEKIVNFQGMEWKSADMVTEIEASRGLMYRPARRAVETDCSLGALKASIAKLYSSRMSERVNSEALQTFDARGFQRGHPLEYLYRLQRGYRIAGGTDEIQKNTIASQLKRGGLLAII